MQGIITKGIGGFYYVKVNDELIECKARGKFRHTELTPMVGDNVEITFENNSGFITKIYPRRNELIRPAVANVTQAFVVFALRSPDLNLDLLNKFLIACEYNQLRVVICLNKIDLCSEEDINSVLNILKGCGYEVFALNAKLNIGIEKLKEKLHDNITVFCGPSGAGKSTLSNKLTGKELMETGDISEKLGRGKHTTRHSELIQIENGFIVDTPGFSSFDISYISKERLPHCFPEFDSFLDGCKFSGCLHHKEPNCCVKDAVESGEISKERYEFYIKSLQEVLDRRDKRW